jgi:hypothetical protein
VIKKNNDKMKKMLINKQKKEIENITLIIMKEKRKQKEMTWNEKKEMKKNVKRIIRIKESVIR